MILNINHKKELLRSLWVEPIPTVVAVHAACRAESCKFRVCYRPGRILEGRFRV